jgi:azurin
MKNKIILFSALLLTLLNFFNSCNKKDSSKKIDPLTVAASMSKEDIKKAKEEEIANLPENTFVIEGDDAMQFNIHELRAKAEIPILIIFKHIGKASVKEMGHNLVIIKPGTNFNDFANRAAEDVTNHYIPKNDTSIVAHTKLLSGGEQDSIRFTINKKGIYDYLCTFPAHSATMKGKLIVE